jgi:hypothetical protein
MTRKKMSRQHQKIFKQTANYNDKRVLNVKPYPIPDLEGKAAEDFERQIKEPLTAVQKQMLAEGALVFAQTKKHK